jgi:hypothetical protein
MTVPTTENQAQDKSNDKELNFRALEAKMQRQVEQERQARLMAEQRAAELEQSHNLRSKEEEDDDADPYIDKKKFKKTLNQFGEETRKQTKAEIDAAVKQALAEERKNQWLKQNPDYHEVMQHAQKLYEHDPELAETILEMPEGYERQKLVYKNIKALGLHKPKPKESTIQETVDKQRRSPYYTPSGQGSSPYQAVPDTSPAGQKAGYDKMQELKARLRI